TTVDAECGTTPAVALVGGVPDFSITQFVPVVNATHSLTLVRASNPFNASATLSGSAPTSPPPALYPGVPAQISASVPSGGGTCQQTVTYAWSILAQPAGSTAHFSNPAAVAPSFVPDVPGSYEFRLVLSDQTGRSTTATLTRDTAGF